MTLVPAIEPHAVESRLAEQVGLEALDLGVVSVELELEQQRHRQGLLEHLLLQHRERLLAGVEIGAGARVGKRLGDLRRRLLAARVEVRALAVEQGEGEAGIGPAGPLRQQPVALGLGEERGAAFGNVEGAEAQLDADLAPHLLQHFLALLLALVVVADQVQLEPVLVAGLGEQCLGLVGIVLVVVLQRRIEGPMRLGQHGRRDLAEAGHRRLGEALAVGRVVQRLAHLDVVERRAREVQEHDHAVKRRPAHGGKILGAVDQRFLLRRQEIDEVVLVGDDGAQGGIDLGDDLHLESVEIGLARLPVFVVPGVGDLLVVVPAHELHRAAADGLAVIVLAQFLHRLG